MKPKKRLYLRGGVTYDRLFPSGLWRASTIYDGYLCTGRADTKRGANQALRNIIAKTHENLGD